VAEFPPGSRGKGLSPRSLEVFDDVGVIDLVLACGVTHLPHRKYRGAEVTAQTDPEADRLATPDTPYPTGPLIPQWRVEQILASDLPTSTSPWNWTPNCATSPRTPIG
jgi:2-polyprenyl-6-methoxyphenol hydroxylase-like FAD-dependent oxidoreductase